MNNLKKKIIISSVIFATITAFLTIFIIGKIISTSIRGNIEVSTTKVNIGTTYTSLQENYSWTYTEAGDTKDINIAVTNNSDTNIHRYYKIECTNANSDKLDSAILVYYNDSYVDTLSNLNNNSSDLDVNDPYAILQKGGSKTDKLSFELHQSAENGLFDGEEVSIKITTYSENVDYINYSVISTESDLSKLFDDIDSGLLDTIPTIVLTNSIVLNGEYTIKWPLVIQTNGYNLSGSITLNDDNTETPDALVTILGSGSVAVTLSQGSNFDKAGARGLVSSYVRETLKYGIKAGSTPEVKNIVGPYSFYNAVISLVSGSLATLSGSNLTASTTLKYTRSENITVALNSVTDTITFKHIGKNSNFDEEHVLVHMPQTNSIINSDLFLPTYVPEYDASIVWNSSNESVMSNDGHIMNDRNDKVKLTLTARIKVNDKVYARSYTFYISSNNNQVNFQKLVNEISPLIIRKKYVEADASNTTYRLPIVTQYDDVNDEYGDYDYRTSFDSPATEPTFSWEAYQDIRLTSLTYSKYYDGTDQNPIDTYDYISVSGNGVTLIKDTLSNYAKIKVTGEFDNGEVYEGIINVSIAVGSDTELLEKAFNDIYNQLDNVSILGNIIKTRKNDGMLAEKGDFTLPATYEEAYTIAYEVADTTGVISCGATPVTIDENLVYQFTVNPTKFDSVETAIPVRATVSYTKSDNSVITKTKFIYITVPAAVHVKDLGNVSIFNSLKYQTLAPLPAAEKAKGTGYSVSTSVRYSGYDYILLRDIVGDEYYLSNYANNSTYLTMNGYDASGSDGTPGVTTIKLYNESSNDTSKTDSLAYDFVRLINWATGDTVALASSVLSNAGQAKISELLNYKSNGEAYLTANELKVLEEFYKASTNDDGTKWNEVKAQALETAPGYIYDNASLLETILRCLTNEKGTNSVWYENNGSVTYGTIYAKYLEVVNRYAITTSENEEPMSPAQEVYNSKFYYSFTATAQNSTSGTATTAVSFPCKYIDASGNLVSGYCNRYSETNWQYGGSGTRQGTYAATSKRGNAAVDLYANATGYPYDSDHTKYITPAELMVLKAFWLGALGSKTELASNNVTHTFSSDSTALITAALAADANGILPYPNYSIGDFTYYGQAILNAFDACLTIPTYFTSNGIGLLINSFYDNFNTTGYKLRDYSDSTDTTYFDSVLINSVPAVTNLDNLEGALSYFAKLTAVDIKGNSDLPIFLSEYGLSTAFARICITNSNVTTLTMQYSSSDYVTFDLTNIKNLKNLTTIDISNNLGIKTLNPLLNVNRSNYNIVNFTNIGEEFEYNEFVIDNLASSTCSVTFTNGLGGTETKDTGNPSLLVNLGNIEDFVSEHLYLTNVIYNDDGTTTEVCWRVEQGNEMNGEEINSGGELEELTSIRDMLLRVSPYYYCNQNFTYQGYTFVQHGLYKVVINNNNQFTVTPINIENGNLTFTVNLVNGVPTTDYSSISDSDPNLTIHDPHLTFSGEYSRTQDPTDSTGTIYSQDSSIVTNEVNYTLRFRYHVFSFQASEYNNGNTSVYTYYLRVDGDVFTCSRSAVAIDCYFVLLNQNQANFMVELKNNNFHNTTDVIMDKYGIVPSNGVITLGSELPNSTTINNYYLYSIANNKFLTVYGFSDEPISKFDVSNSNQNINGSGSYSVYSIFNKDNSKYLAQTKIYTKETTTTTRYAIGVVYYKTPTNNRFNEAGNSNYKRFRTYWQNYSSNYYTLGNTITCAENTPTLDITMGKDMQATAYFNCVYIGNGTDAASSAYKMYDTGIFLLNSNSSSDYGENAIFCFLTQEEKDRLEEWYDNPLEDITIGSTPVNYSYYYIYCPYTRRFISGGATDRNGEIYKTVASFDSADLYYIYKSTYPSGGYYIVHNSLANSIAGRTDPTNSTTGIPGFNAYGGNGVAAYIALYHGDPNSTCVFNEIPTPYEISYEIKASSAQYIAYQVDYTVAKVRAHILERDISKEYKFDNFYYLNEDIVIDGITYKAGNVIRFVCDAYYGIQYEADIEYYELTLTYYDDKDKTDNATHKHTINQFNTANYIYYFYDYLNNVNAFSDGEIIYTKLPSGVFENYNQSATYTNHTNPSGVTITFPETKWIYTTTSFDSVKSNLYLDSEGANSAANATYNEGTTYYREKYVVATVFENEFESRKSSLYTDTNGTHVAANATFSPSTTYYEVGYTQLSSLTLTSNITSSYYRDNVLVTTVDVPVFEYYKYGIYLDTNGTRVPLSATYNANTTYYFYDGTTYSTELPRYYSALISDSVPLILDATTFEYFKHNIYSDDSGTLVSLGDQYNYDKKYYTDNYVVSNFKNEVLNTYRSVLYKDSKGTVLDMEETFNPNITYYTNEFVVATVTAGTWNNMKSRLYADQYGLALAANATYDNTMTYYKKVYIVAEPEPSGNTEEDWITTKNQITRLYSHTKLATSSNLDTYTSDYSKAYDGSQTYPIVYKYTGSGTENIYANPTIEASYEPIRTGSVTAENFDSMKSSLYDDVNGTPLAANATFVSGKIYYVRTWTTVANIVKANVSYVYNYSYYLEKQTDFTIDWVQDQSGVDSNTAGTMDAILADANSHFHDEHYNEWYGKHYAYNGFTMQSANEILDIDGSVVQGYDNGYVYRIVVNGDNTAFIWQKVYRYYRKEGPTMVTEASTGVAQVSDTIWATTQCFNGFYTARKFYRVVADDFTKTLNVIQFTDVSIVNNIANGYTDIQNKKIRYIYQGDYLGYAGTFEVIISAVVKESDGNGGYNYTDNVRTYKIKFVGTVIM